MPYTRSLLEEELKRGERLQVVLPWKLFSLSFFIFIGAIVVYLGMNFGYVPYLNTQIKNIDKDIESLSQSVGEQEKNELINFYSQLVNINKLIDSQAKASAVLSFLEKNTHKKVRYTSLAFDAKSDELRISGVASSYEVISEQLNIFSQAPEVESVFLDSSASDKEIKGARFEIRLRFL